MKGLLLSLLAFVCLLLAVMGSLRLYRGKRYFHVLILCFFVSAGLYWFFYRNLPSNLGFLPGAWMEPDPRFDFWNGLIVLFLIFHSFWDFAYTTAFTGFSSNLLVLLSKQGSLKREEIDAIYSRQGFSREIMDWRLPNLVKGNYVALEEGRLRLLWKGRLFAVTVLFLKRLLVLREGE